jgi:CBS domain-containing protein
MIGTRTDRGVPGTPARPLNDLRRTLVREVMTAVICSVSPADTFEQAARELRTNQVRALPVLDRDGILLGVVSAHDLMHTARLGDPRREAPAGRWHRGGDGPWARPRTAAQLMTSPVVSVPPTASAADAARTMYENSLGWLAVVHPTPDGRDRLVGVVVRSDLLRVLERTDGNPRDEFLACLGTLRGPVDWSSCYARTCQWGGAAYTQAAGGRTLCKTLRSNSVDRRAGWWKRGVC